MNEPITLVTRSTFVCFGTIQCGVIKPTNMTLEHLNVNVRDEVTSQRIALQIAFKHIIKVMVASYGNLVGIVILVNNFCARRIRETFQISQEPNVLLAANVPYFHPESCRICQRYIIVDMNDCQVPQLMTFFKLVEKRRLEIVADLNRRRGETGDYDTDCFLSGMPSDEYMLLLQEVGVAPPDIPRMTRVTPPVRYYTIDANGRQVLQSEGGVPVAVNGQTFQQRFVSHPSTSSAPPQHLNSVMKINPWNGSGKMCPSSSSPLTETANMRNTLPTESRPSRNTVKRIVHLIEEDELEEAKKTPRVDDTIVIYSRGQHGAVSVHFNDMECLKPDQMLNDTIIDFYMKYIQYEMVPAERRSSIYIFSSFFYPRITQMGRNGTGLFPKSLSVRQKLVRANFEKVKTWTKNVDLFAMDYVVIPINEDIHWFLAIVTFPRLAIVGSAGSKSHTDIRIERKAHIVILDSLHDETDHRRKLLHWLITEYLEHEYNDKRKLKAARDEKFDRNQVDLIYPRCVPQQKNYTDCGLFMLKYTECFLVNPPMLIVRTDSFRSWYPRFNILGMRSKIFGKLKAMCDSAKWKLYEEYSESHVTDTKHDESLPTMSFLDNRSPSPPPRSRSFSDSDRQEVAEENRRKRSLSS